MFERSGWFLMVAACASACGDDSAGRPCATCDAVGTTEPTQDGGTEVSLGDDTSTTADAAEVVACTIACPAPTYCDTSTGFPQCVCPEGYAGGDCERCATGWRQLEDGGACVPSCARVAACGQGTCNDILGPVTCECPIGRVGNRCESCAPGLTRGDDDHCALPRSEVAAGTLIVPHALAGGAYQLLTVDDDGGVMPIAGRYQRLHGSSFDWDGETAFVIVSDVLGARPVDGGESELVDLEPLRLESAQFAGPVLDLAGERAFIAQNIPGFANSDSQILAVDLVTHDVTPVGLMFQRSARALAWDEDAGALWVLTDTEVVRFDPDTGLTTRVFEHAEPLGVTYTPTSMALTEDALVIAALAPDPTAWLRLRCAELARRFGTDPAALRVSGTYRDGFGSETLTTDARVPSLVVYGARRVDPNTFQEPFTLTIATTHPDDVVCVVLDSLSATVELAEGSTPRQVIVASWSSSVSLTGPATYEPHPGQLVTIGSTHATYGESTHYDPAAVGVFSYQPAARDTLLFLDRDGGAPRWVTLPSRLRDVPGITTAP